MSSENVITEILPSNDQTYIDNHMKKMNDDGFELVHIHEVVRDKSVADKYRLFWRKTEWQQ